MSAQLDMLERDVVQARRRVHDGLANLRGPVSLKNDLTATAESVITDIKDRLASNPVATAAIGAGVAWQLVRRPPVASLLVGYGIYSLIKTDPRHPTPMSGYAMRAVEAGQAMTDRAAQLAGEARAVAADRLHAARETAAQAVDAVKSTATQWTDSAAQAASGAAEALTEGAATARERAPQLAATAQEAVRREKDTYLLGFAAAALAAAIGISAQRRAS